MVANLTWDFFHAKLPVILVHKAALLVAKPCLAECSTDRLPVGAEERIGITGKWRKRLRTILFVWFGYVWLTCIFHPTIGMIGNLTHFLDGFKPPYRCTYHYNSLHVSCIVVHWFVDVSASLMPLRCSAKSQDMWFRPNGVRSKIPRHLDGTWLRSYRTHCSI